MPEQVNPASQSNPVSEVTPTKKPINWKLISIVTIVAAVVIGGVGYFIFKSYGPQKVNLLVSEPKTPTSSAEEATPSADAAGSAGSEPVTGESYEQSLKRAKSCSKSGSIMTDASTWGIFTGTKDKYSIKCPPGWKVIEDINHIGPDWSEYDHFYISMEEFEPGVNIFVTPETTATAWAKKNYSATYADSSFKKIKVDGYEAKRFDGEPGQDPFVIVNKNNKSYIIQGAKSANEDQSKFSVAIFNNMVSSFKFLD